MALDPYQFEAMSPLYVSAVTPEGLTLALSETLTVEDVDGVPSYSDVSKIQLDQADGFAITNPSPGVVRVDFSAAGITVEEVDGSPSYSGVTTLRFDQADGFSLSQPAAGIARVDLPFSGARVSDSGLGQSIPSGTATAVTFDSEQYDTDAYHDGGNPSRLTAPVDGYYHMGGWISWNGSSFAGSVGLSFYMLINGSTFFVPVQVLRVTVGSENAGQHVSTDYQLSAGDYVELFASQASGGTLTLNTSPQAWIHRIH